MNEIKNLPLTQNQTAIWLDEVFYGASSMYNIGAYYEIKGDFNPAVFSRAMDVNIGSTTRPPPESSMSSTVPGWLPKVSSGHSSTMAHWSRCAVCSKVAAVPLGRIDS